MKWNEITSIEQALHLKQTQPEAFAQMLKEADLSFDYLAGSSLYLFQKHGMFRNNTDTAMLGQFMEIRKGETVLDIGTNNGALLLYASLQGAGSCIGVEIQEEACELAAFNLQLHQIDARILAGDIKDVSGIKADVIVSNPPYFPAPDARVKPTSRQIARHEFYLDLETLIQCISELIAENGRCYIVHRADRICDLVALLQQHSMEIKRMQFVYDEAKADARSVIIEAKRHAKSGCRVVKPIILTR